MSDIVSLLAAACMVGAAIFAVREGSQLRKINRTLAKVVKDLQVDVAALHRIDELESAVREALPYIDSDCPADAILTQALGSDAEAKP